MIPYRSPYEVAKPFRLDCTACLYLKVLGFEASGGDDPLLVVQPLQDAVQQGWDPMTDQLGILIPGTRLLQRAEERLQRRRTGVTCRNLHACVRSLNPSPRTEIGDGVGLCGGRLKLRLHQAAVLGMGCFVSDGGPKLALSDDSGTVAPVLRVTELMSVRLNHSTQWKMRNTYAQAARSMTAVPPLCSVAPAEQHLSYRA